MRPRDTLATVTSRAEAVLREIASDADLSGDFVTQTLLVLDEECRRKLSAGRKDVFGSLAVARETFIRRLEKHRKDLGLVDADFADRSLLESIFQLFIRRLRDEGDLVLSGDRLRARSRAFEVVHYLRNLKQRTRKGERDGVSPSLVELLKVEVRERTRPQRTIDRFDFVEAIRDEVDLEMERHLDQDDAFPPGDHWRDVLDLFEGFLKAAFPSEDFRVAEFQREGTTRLLDAALRAKPRDAAKAFVITAGTGFGKTEAFLFPILIYSIYATLRKARTGRGDRPSAGVDAILLYPRRDLCDNQAERLLGYLMHLNAVLEKEWPLDEKFRPIRLGIAHGGVDRSFQIRCPQCEVEKKQCRRGEWTDEDDSRAVIRAITEDGKDYPVQGFACQRAGDKHQNVCGYLVYQVRAELSSGDSDIVISTVDTLHRRLMDKHGAKRIFKHEMLPRFLVVDEMHVYDGQAGSHTANILRRTAHRIRRASDEGVGEPRLVFVGASATVGQPETLGGRIFGVDKEDVGRIRPGAEESRIQGLEYFFFLRAPGNRVIDSAGSTSHRPTGELDSDDERDGAATGRFVSEQATMIQAAMCLQHGMKAPAGSGSEKRRTLGFVDSIDVAQRLSSNLHSPEWEFLDRKPAGGIHDLPLYALRFPAGRPNADLSEQVASAAREFLDDAGGNVLFDERLRAGCPRRSSRDCHQPPHPILERCDRYEDGECWYAMANDGEEGLRPIAIQTHRSGSRRWGDVDRRYQAETDRDRWRLLVSTSALEVGFDHEELIATWQYHAPPTIASFVQRKGRGGRGVRDFPITMVVLGPSSGDSFFFQNHLLLVDVSDSDVVTYVDDSNPSIRCQHVISAVFDCCASMDPTAKAYHQPDFEAAVQFLQDGTAQAWAQAVFPDTSAATIEQILRRFRQHVTDVLTLPLRTRGIVDRPITPVELFAQPSGKSSELLGSAREKLKASEGVERKALQAVVGWAGEAVRFQDKKSVRTIRHANAVDISNRVPLQLQRDPDLRIPQTTIPVPLGRFVQVMKADSEELLDAEPAEFALHTFLPGGFKIRYHGRLWMAPWDEVPEKPKEHNRGWANIAPYLVDAPRDDVPVTAHELTEAAGLLSSSKAAEVLETLGEDCLLVPVAGVKVADLGRGRTRTFQLDETHLKIVPRKPDGADSARFTQLTRDPHVDACRFVVPLRRGADVESVRLESPSPLFTRIDLVRDLQLLVGHTANLVHCYPKVGSVRTLVIRFWDARKARPVCPSIVQQAEALELLVDLEQINSAEDWGGGAERRAFWRRVERLLIEDLVVRQGKLSSAYLVPAVNDFLQQIETKLGGKLGAFREQAPTPEDLCRVADDLSEELDQRALPYGSKEARDEARTHAAEICDLLRDASVWGSEHGRAWTLGDTLAAALARLAGMTLGISPASVRRLVEPDQGRLRVFLYDDYEGGGGQSRRMADAFRNWGGSDLLRHLNHALECPAARSDEVLEQIMRSQQSPEVLAALAQANRLDELVCKPRNGSGPNSDLATSGSTGEDLDVSRSLRRASRLVESPDLAAFYLYAHRERLSLSERIGGAPPHSVFVDHVFRTPALDPRAEELRLQFLEVTSPGAVPELGARLLEIESLCASGCPECLDINAFERGFIDRKYLSRIVTRLVEGME